MTPVDSKRGRSPAGRRGATWTIHFFIAAGLMTITAVGWQAAVRWLGVVTQKQAVAWPDHVTVSDDFRLRSLPETIGPYELLRGPEDKPGEPMGEHILPKDVRETLGVGSGYDEARFPYRKSNWYVSRIYVDTRIAPQSSPYWAWNVQMTYYTGGMDTVPHVPEVCLVAGGASLTGGGQVTAHVPQARSPWDEPFELNRTTYTSEKDEGLVTVTNQHVQYYVFSLNGVPENDWKDVRLELTLPWVRRCYFGKIQFAPLGAVQSEAVADEKAREFLRTCLPEFLKAFPTPEQVAEAGEGG
jgi:hypothetical protein